ncbi:hypothetical protein [Deinococcus radiotolerans]|uniref:Phage head-tail adapter protein n=1 Tax=Deinococcus radiotolerans TaxID=1309407 RepID=A0ABQ2FEU9_9DEIO|nr:hypothetical protein [Deinococcus radiotolerans]GGK91403.1 hypothetical protein GCM10010844_07390 [Deinococcus radiotolerans]
MQLPASFLTTSAQVLTHVESPPDALGQTTKAWTAGQTLPCAHFPAGERVTRQAQLAGVSVAREVYLPRINLNPQTNRLVIDGTMYALTLVNEWDGFTVAGVVSR